MIHDLNDNVLAYAEEHSTEEPEVLRRLRRSTWQHVLTPQMLSDSIQGRFLANLSRMLKPLSVLEFGTYTGYSTICLAAGLQKAALTPSSPMTSSTPFKMNIGRRPDSLIASVVTTGKLCPSCLS